MYKYLAKVLITIQLTAIVSVTAPGKAPLSTEVVKNWEMCLDHNLLFKIDTLPFPLLFFVNEQKNIMNKAFKCIYSFIYAAHTLSTFLVFSPKIFLLFLKI